MCPKLSTAILDVLISTSGHEISSREVTFAVCGIFHRGKI